MKYVTVLTFLWIVAQSASAQPATIRITGVDSTRIGGLYNFRFPVHDETKLREQFGGHDIEFRFETIWEAKQLPPVPPALFFGVYDRRIVVHDRTTDRALAEYRMLINRPPCDTASNLYLSEIAGIFLNDPDYEYDNPSRDKWRVIGNFTTDKNCYGEDQLIGGVFDFAFDYALEQWGGTIRQEAPVVLRGDADTRITASNGGTRTVDSIGVGSNYVIGRSYNNGPATYEVEFLPGGTESVMIRYGSKSATKMKVFEVPYLNVSVRNSISYVHTTSGGGTAEVTYPDEIPHHTIDDIAANSTEWPDAEDVPVGTFNLSAYGWVNGRFADGLIQDRPKQAAGPGHIEGSQNRGLPVGTQGRYYLSAISDGDTVDFAHVLLASGTEFIMDFANKRGRKASPPQWNWSSTQPTIDFESGDMVHFSVFGGALGLPLPDARVVVHIDTIATDVDEAETLAGSVVVSPNPVGDNATIRYTLDRPTHVTLTVVDALGRTVAVLADEYRQPGAYSSTLRAGELNSGYYFYRLNAGGNITTGKLVVLH